jgi:hypothetical protein
MDMWSPTLLKELSSNRSVIIFDNRGADDPESGKIFDTGIINDGDRSAPLRLMGVKVGDGISYYCMVHPSMTGKLIVISPTTGQNTTTTA